MGLCLPNETVPAIVLVVIAEVVDKGISVEALVDLFARHAELAGELTCGDSISGADERVDCPIYVCVCAWHEGSFWCAAWLV